MLFFGQTQKYATNLDPPKKRLKNQTDTNEYIVKFPCPIYRKLEK